MNTTPAGPSGLGGAVVGVAPQTGPAAASEAAEAVAAMIDKAAGQS